MKEVVGIIAAVILLVSGGHIVPKAIMQFKKETIKKVDRGLSPLSSFTSKLN